VASCVWQPSAMRSATARRMSGLSGVGLEAMVRRLVGRLRLGRVGKMGVVGLSQVELSQLPSSQFGGGIKGSPHSPLCGQVVGCGALKISLLRGRYLTPPRQFGIRTGSPEPPPRQFGIRTEAPEPPPRQFGIRIEEPERTFHQDGKRPRSRQSQPCHGGIRLQAAVAQAWQRGFHRRLFHPKPARKTS
jgi:hypothetical protein